MNSWSSRSTSVAMASRRDFPYIWATWLPRLLVGDRSCEWAEWWEEHGADVRLEQQNASRLRGETAVLAGRTWWPPGTNASTAWT